MGTAAAPVIANLWMADWEKEPLSSTSSLLYFRFLDDILILWFSEHEEGKRFCDRMNSIHSNIIVDWNYSTATMNYLDINLFFGHNYCLQYQVHQKLLNRYLYIPWSSYHRKSQLTAFIRGELIRYRRLSSCEHKFNEVRTLFVRRLRARGYPAMVIHKVLKNVKYNERHLDFLPRREVNGTPITLTLELTPATEYLCDRANACFYLPKVIKQAPMKNPRPIHITWRKGKPLRNHLSRCE